MRGQQPSTQTMKASDARQNFSQLLNQVFRGETRILVEKSGIPVAAIVSAQDLERLAALDERRAERFKALEESWQAFDGVSVNDLEEQVTMAVAAVRQKQRDAKPG